MAGGCCCDESEGCIEIALRDCFTFGKVENSLNAKVAKVAKGREGLHAGVGLLALAASSTGQRRTASTQRTRRTQRYAEENQEQKSKGLEGVRERYHPASRATLRGRLFPLQLQLLLQSSAYLCDLCDLCVKAFLPFR